ncbi:MAG: cyclic nucleotide-binding domain-containing protein, partial [Deltaproteobacteria bacterium]
YEEGDREAFLCLIVSGSVKVCKSYGMPTEKILITLGPGETVGEVSVIDEMPRSASVVANSDTILYALTRNNLIGMCNASHILWAKLIFNITLSLCNRLRHTNDMLVEALNGGVTSESLSGNLNVAIAKQHPFLKAS